MIGRDIGNADVGMNASLVGRSRSISNSLANLRLPGPGCVPKDVLGQGNIDSKKLVVPSAGYFQFAIDGFQDTAPRRLAVDLDDTLIHGSQTCPGLWDLGRGYSDPAIAPGYRYADMRISLRGRTHLMRGRPRYDAVDRSAHPFMSAPRVIVSPSLPMLSALAWLKERGAILALATASARQRVEWLFDRLPVLQELFGSRVMAAEDLACRTIAAAEGPDDCDTDLWKMSQAVHDARPFSLAAKTPWALAPMFDGEPYDLLIDDSAVTTKLLTDHGLEDRLHQVPGDAFAPAQAWEVVTGLLARLTGQAPAPTGDFPTTEVLRMEDPLYLPLMHRHDQFEWKAEHG